MNIWHAFSPFCSHISTAARIVVFYGDLSNTSIYIPDSTSCNNWFLVLTDNYKKVEIDRQVNRKSTVITVTHFYVIDEKMLF